jgi:hypothetical protein
MDAEPDLAERSEDILRTSADLEHLAELVTIYADFPLGAVARMASQSGPGAIWSWLACGATSSAIRASSSPTCSRSDLDGLQQPVRVRADGML